MIFNLNNVVLYFDQGFHRLSVSLAGALIVKDINGDLLTKKMI